MSLKRHNSKHAFRLNENVFSINVSAPKIPYECKGCFLFKKHEIDYRRGTSETILLLNQKIVDIGKETEHTHELYSYPKYKDSSSS